MAANFLCKWLRGHNVASLKKTDRICRWFSERLVRVLKCVLCTCVSDFAVGVSELKLFLFFVSVSDAFVEQICFVIDGHVYMV